MPPPRADARILVVDDEDSNVALLKAILKRGQYENVLGTMDPREVMDLLDSFEPDLILLDLHMPHLDGFEVLTQLHERVPADEYLPILVLTADVTTNAKERALAMGAKDFLTKPFDTTEVLLRIRNLLHARFLHVELREHNRSLRGDLDDARMEVALRLARVVESREGTGDRHSRIASMSLAIAERIGMDPRSAALVEQAAPLLDIGNIGLPDALLLKQGVLTSEERTEMQTHTVVGAGVLSGSRLPLLQVAESIAGCHHERWDGAGYPYGLSGSQIPLAARIVTVADVFEAMTHDRPYRAALTEAGAIEQIERQADAQFDPRVVQAFLGLMSARKASA
jgi:putative two-component system response regulator